MTEELIKTKEEALKKLAESYNLSELDSIRFIGKYAHLLEEDYPYALEYKARVLCAMNLIHIEGYKSGRDAIEEAFGNSTCEPKDGDYILNSTEEDYKEDLKKTLTGLGITFDLDEEAIFAKEESLELN